MWFFKKDPEERVTEFVNKRDYSGFLRTLNDRSLDLSTRRRMVWHFEKYYTHEPNDHEITLLIQGLPSAPPDHDFLLNIINLLKDLSFKTTSKANRVMALQKMASLHPQINYYGDQSYSALKTVADQALHDNLESLLSQEPGKNEIERLKRARLHALVFPDASSYIKVPLPNRQWDPEPHYSPTFGDIGTAEHNSWLKDQWRLQDEQYEKEYKREYAIYYAQSQVYLEAIELWRNDLKSLYFKDMQQNTILSAWYLKKVKTTEEWKNRYKVTFRDPAEYVDLTDEFWSDGNRSLNKDSLRLK